MGGWLEGWLDTAYTLASASLLTSLVLLLLLGLAALVVRLLAARQRARQPVQLSAAFFHPYCNAGGGGERVLWCAVRAVQARYPAVRLIIYTGDTDAAPDMILAKARDRFNMDISPNNLEFVYLHRRHWVEAEYYPHFTMLGQSLGSLVLGLEALLAHVPSIYFDTMGFSFTLPLFRLCGGSLVGCYVHYPTISTDMLAAVRSGRPGTVHNRGSLARLPPVRAVKLRYYKLFAWLYGLAGAAAECVMVNSSWTEEHITQLWGGAPVRVFPPCDPAPPPARPASPSHQLRILSLGQFRPEKDHPLQIKAMFELRQLLSEEDWGRVRLVIVGGCRGPQDWKLVQDLKDLTKYLSVEDNVEFHPNLPYPDLVAEFGRATIGIHTMWNEHFGIGVVEMMAAGLLTIAHRSGGPLMDIVVEESGARSGFLAVTAQEYAAHMAYILSLGEEGREAVRARAAASSQRFTSQQFQAGWIRATDPLFTRLF